ncbi:hypothetical protein RvY_05202 [Ramazzottius varieornatus]|uniref:Pyridine nucleotide-disulfide oxidoreductase domain-containing protein 2 n=1 Tax=Ramazzottius varieornatus TaxID=947166 RepID=A0A1D1UXB1_RAMVA|nr:hypothetical protein RvY_05202 [Ramazzottius varieornatus]
MDENSNYHQIAQFSARDAEAFVKYEKFLNQLVDSIDPLFDVAPPRFSSNTRGLAGNWDNLQSWRELMRALGKFRGIFPDVYELITAPIAKVLNKRFESDPLKATLATDGLIGSSLGPSSAGSGYVLLHHVMGRLEGRKGAWAYVEGGMGAVAETLANVLRSAGGEIMCNHEVEQILVFDGKVEGVQLKGGEEVKAKMVLSGATVRETMLKLLPEGSLDLSVKAEVEGIDYSSPVVKINVAMSRIPDFSKSGNIVQPHHRATIHLNSENMGMLESAHKDYIAGKPSEKPFMEMVIPSSLDPTIAPPGAHVALLFIQYIPYAVTKLWKEKERTDFAQKVFKQIDDYAPGFSASVVGYEVLTPDILESTFGLTGGNIFHGALSWDQLFFSRPSSNLHGYRTPIQGLYLCGSGCHPGGGVTGAPGRLGALTALQDFRR